MAYFVIFVRRRPITSAPAERRIVRYVAPDIQFHRGVRAVEKIALNIPCGTFGDRRNHQYSQSGVAHTAGTTETTGIFASGSLVKDAGSSLRRRARASRCPELGDCPEPARWTRDLKPPVGHSMQASICRRHSWCSFYREQSTSVSAANQGKRGSIRDSQVRPAASPCSRIRANN